ncbi:MAG: hypothetical protein M3410_06265 [Acidobacteriota bacterium]|nr:hypothetical protein [Acidobacteriota bacterium]
MENARIAKTLLMLGLALAVFLALEATGLAQCSMCRASLAGSNNPFFLRNFNFAVLVLLTPPVAIFCSIFLVLRRHSTPENDATDPDRPRPWV